MYSKEESEHHAKVLNEASLALQEKDSTKLRELSDMTIHSACEVQDSASVTVAIILYALSKLIERADFQKIKDWNKFVKKISSCLKLSAKAIKENNQEAYNSHTEKTRKILTSESISLKPYIEDVLKKSSINKGSKIYEHGISIEKTSKLLGISQWELSEYIGQKSSREPQSLTIDVKKRAKMTLEFFSK